MTTQNNRAGAIWIREAKNGGTMLSIKIEIHGKAYNFTAFENTYKKAGDNKPDYNILLSKQAPQEKPAPTYDESDDIPF
jgi:hypothetical protein